MLLPRRDDLRRPAVLFLLAANLVPVVGVLALGWRLADILLLFWLESAIIGAYNIVKMLLIGDPKAAGLVPFFIIHYGFFMFGHLVFLSAFFVIGLDPNNFSGGSLALVPEALRRTSPAALALVVSHGVSFVNNFLRGGERKTTEIGRLMFAPYPRIFVMHLTILAGGFAILTLGEPWFALVVLVALKTGVDLVAHVSQHAKWSRPAAVPTATETPLAPTPVVAEQPTMRPHGPRRG
ncbi:MAG: hypothetical protein HYT80_04655 [Euryarchaeota archaeon]|nr:hypothetical protein [Euryarchaeota archaeon]